jgi:hypothetical protein
MPSAEALARAMKDRYDITKEDLLSGWLKWAHAQPGPFPFVDKAFLTWSAQHEATPAERQRAARASRSTKGETGPTAVRDLLRKRGVMGNCETDPR